MNSRERVELALNHRQPDCVPLDLGGSAVSGMHVSSVYLLRQALHLDEPGTRSRLLSHTRCSGKSNRSAGGSGVDVVPAEASRTFFGFRNEDWKPWTLFDGTPVLVPGAFNTEPEPSGDILMYPKATSRRRPAGVCRTAASTSIRSSGSHRSMRPPWMSQTTSRSSS